MAAQRRRRGSFVKRFFIMLIVLALIAGIGVVAGLRWLNQPYKGFSAPETFVEIPPGTGVNAIGHRLVDAGVIRNSYAFRLAMRVADDNRPLKAGEYRFTDALTPAEVIEKLARGDVYLRPITFPEGLTISEMGGIFEQHGFGSAKEFVEAAKSSEAMAAIRELDPAARSLEGYVFPETYALPRHTTAPMLVGQMVDRFKHVTSELRAEAQARAGSDTASQPMTLRELVTLASIVEKETAKAEERPLVAAVYRNRLRIGMPLQCDPTVIYALRQAGVYNGNLTRTNLQFDSRYNTYRYPGLPPGPIASPGRASLEAAAHPADVPYLYFVSKNDGSHVFATTLAEHNRNVQQYQVLYFRNNRATVQPSGASRATLRSRNERSVARAAAPASRG
jgi:UPF0755 protein